MKFLGNSSVQHQDYGDILKNSCFENFNSLVPETEYQGILKFWIINQLVSKQKFEGWDLTIFAFLKKVQYQRCTLKRSKICVFKKSHSQVFWWIAPLSGFPSLQENAYHGVLFSILEKSYLKKWKVCRCILITATPCIGKFK